MKYRRSLWGREKQRPAAGRYDTTAGSRTPLLVLEGRLTPEALNELIRLLESGKIQKLTDRDLLLIAEYRPITVDGEPFFEAPFSCGKESAACLAYAIIHGCEEVLQDLKRLRATMRPASSAT